jgi:peptidoglycan biosynthesis protein MviN/MurJ (putative lipid II flippase)
MIAVNVALNLTLIWIPGVRESGLAWATAISAVLQTLFLSMLCARTLRRLGAHHRIADAHLRSAVAKIAAASLIMAALVWTALALLPFSSPLARPNLPRFLAPLASDWSWQLTRLVLCSGVGGIAYLALSRLLRIPELSWLMHHPSEPSGASRRSS